MGKAGDLVSRAASRACPDGLPAAQTVTDAAAAAVDAMRGIDPGMRPRDGGGRPGLLLELPELPTVLVPDLHARPDFLSEVLAWKGPPSAPFSPDGRAGLADLLEGGEANLVCLGDLFHSEAAGARERWSAASREFAGNWASREAMDREMSFALSLSLTLLDAMAAFPRQVHCLKGNHDNVTNSADFGDRPFFKFSSEGEMTASWFAASYGKETAWAWRRFELELPLVAKGGLFAASHAEPAHAISRDDLVEGRGNDKLRYSLTWTANDEAEDGSVQSCLRALFGASAGSTRWFSGHRPVSGRYTLRAEGRLVQFHDPHAKRVALLWPGKAPDPDTAIFDLS